MTDEHQKEIKKAQKRMLQLLTEKYDTRANNLREARTALEDALDRIRMASAATDQSFDELMKFKNEMADRDG